MAKEKKQTKETYYKVLSKKHTKIVELLYKMAYERIDETKTFDGPVREEHEVRYRIAGGFVRHDDTVLDIGCGIGYGQNLLKSMDYIGIDKNPVKAEHIKVDLEQVKPDNVLKNIGRDIDVVVALEVIEHLDDYGVDTLVKIAKKATKWIIVSTPIVRNSNPFHKQQFTEEAIIKLFVDNNWRQYAGTIKQDNERYGIFIFKKI